VHGTGRRAEGMNKGKKRESGKKLSWRAGE